jgi:hypothetical protein
MTTQSVVLVKNLLILGLQAQHKAIVPVKNSLMQEKPLSIRESVSTRKNLTTGDRALTVEESPTKRSHN